VLQAALDDFRDGSARTGAIAYLESSDRVWPFSFENLCEALDMNAGDVRRQLRGDPARIVALSLSEVEA
jgi:hypothetical protein